MSERTLSELQEGLGERDARGMTAIEAEFVSGRLLTASIAAEQGLPDGLWAIRYTQDIPRLLREVMRLRVALSDLLEFHEDEPERPAVRFAREVLGSDKVAETKP